MATSCKCNYRADNNCFKAQVEVMVCMDTHYTVKTTKHTKTAMVLKINNEQLGELKKCK